MSLPSVSAPQLQFYTSKDEEDPVIRRPKLTVQQAYNVKRGQLSVSIPAKGYSIGQGKKTRYAITLNPDVFFAGTKTCTHRPTYVKWQSSPPPPPAKQPEKVEQAPLPKVDTPPPAKEIEKLEKELLWTKKKLETLKQEYKTTIQAVKEKNQMEMKELKENQKIEIKVLETTHGMLIDRMKSEHADEVAKIQLEHSDTITTLRNEVHQLNSSIREMRHKHKAELQNQQETLHEEAEEKLKQLNDRLVAKFEEDLKIKIELITSDLTSRHQQALLEERQTNETYVSTIKERFAKASSLNDELIRSLKNLKTLQAENSKMKEKMADKVAELRKTQEELILADEKIKSYRLQLDVQAQDVEDQHRTVINNLLHENTQMRQSVFLHREQLNKVKLKKEIESRELYHKLTLKYRMNRSLY